MILSVRGVIELLDDGVLSRRKGDALSQLLGTIHRLMSEVRIVLTEWAEQSTEELDVDGGDQRATWRGAGAPWPLEELLDLVGSSLTFQPLSRHDGPR